MVGTTCSWCANAEGEGEQLEEKDGRRFVICIAVYWIEGDSSIAENNWWELIDQTPIEEHATYEECLASFKNWDKRRVDLNKEK